MLSRVRGGVLVRADGHGLQASADLWWCGDQQRLELVGGLPAGFDRATADHPQHTDRLHYPVAELRDNSVGASQHRPGGSVGVDRVRLTLRVVGPGQKADAASSC